MVSNCAVSCSARVLADDSPGGGLKRRSSIEVRRDNGNTVRCYEIARGKKRGEEQKTASSFVSILKLENENEVLKHVCALLMLGW